MIQYAMHDKIWRAGLSASTQLDRVRVELQTHYVLITAPAAGSHMTCARSQPKRIAPMDEKYGAPE